MEQSEIDVFLINSKIPLRLGTSDLIGDPMIHPVWYHYANGRIYLMSTKNQKKVRNIEGKKTVYFSVDTDAMPNRGVKGKGTAVFVKDPARSVSISEKIVAKYLGDLNSPMAKRMVNAVREGSEVMIEITPHYFST